MENLVNLPEVRSNPCFDCPWVRTSVPGWLGPYTAMEWVFIAMGESPIACHITIETDEGEEYGAWDQPGLLQCAGAAIYRSNICKDPRNQAVATMPEDLELVFGMGEFEKHHG